MEDLLNIVAKRANQYHQDLSTRSVAPHPAAVEELARLDVALPEHPTDPATVVEILDRIGSPATVASAGGRYFGFVVGGSLPAALAANWLAAAWDQNALCSMTSPVAARLEEISLRWLLELFHLPTECAGSFVTGATMANLTALAAARHAVLIRLGWDVESQGLFGAPPVTVIVGAEAHPTLLKAIGLLGLGHDRVLRIPADDQGRMCADALPESPVPPSSASRRETSTRVHLTPWRKSVPRRMPPGLGPRQRCLRPVGRRGSRASTPYHRVRRGRLMGHRCPQMAQRPL